MSAPGTVFFLTAAAVIGVHLRYQVPFYRAISRLAAELSRRGIEWSYWHDWRMRLRFHSDSNAIFCETDTPEIRTMKQEVVERRNAIFASLPVLLKIAVIGFVLMLAAGLGEALLKGKP
jgi:hypothetical protein